MNTRSDSERKLLAEWCLCVARFLDEREPGSAIVRDIGPIIEAQRGNLRGLRMMARDLDEYARGLPADMKAELERVLQSAVGRGLGSRRTRADSQPPR